MEAAAPRIDSQEALEEVFDRVRSTYFPRWRSGENWSIKLGAAPGRPELRGHCDLETRIIWMIPQWRDDEIAEAVVIHEIVHAVVGRAGHGMRFQRRLLKAAEVAEAQGNAALAAALREDAEAWANEPVHRASDTYVEVRDCAWNVTHYEALRHEVAEREGLLPEEFDKRYPRARRVYEEVRREKEEEERTQAETMAAMSRQDE